MSLYGVTTILTASQWICNNIYDNRVNCRCMGFASLIHTNFSFEQQDDHCPNRSTTPLPMWYIVSPPSPGLSIDSQQSEPLPPWREMQLSPTPHHCSFRVLLSHTVGEESESIRDESESGERPPWRGMQLPLPKGLQIVKVEQVLISSGAFWELHFISPIYRSYSIFIFFLFI